MNSDCNGCFNAHFEFDIPLVPIQRTDKIEIKEKILGMTPDQRKKLGINKSTLWYMIQNVSSKDKIKIYDKILDKLKD